MSRTREISVSDKTWLIIHIVCLLINVPFIVSGHLNLLVVASVGVNSAGIAVRCMRLHILNLFKDAK